MASSSGSRQQQIEAALAQVQQQPGSAERVTIPIRGGLLVDVVQLPLAIPLLNTESFRIAPALQDHPEATIVAKDPHSPRAQEIVAELVAQSHRHRAELKASLLAGQDQPGLITRVGKLINANTRCVLLRELVAEGANVSGTLRVAVLPPDITNAEELELESVLQKQHEHKDEYNLVSELMMLEKLHSSGMTDKQIASRLRFNKRGARGVQDLREVLVLMDRARNLSSTRPPITSFIPESGKDQTQNWIELLKEVRDLDANEGRIAGDRHIRGWLVAYYTGNDSVHALRFAKGDWLTRDVIAPMKETPTPVVESIVDAIQPAATGDGVGSTPSSDTGLSLLDDEPIVPVETDAAERLLDIVVDARKDLNAPSKLDPSANAQNEDVLRTIGTQVQAGLKARKQRAEDAERLRSPLSLVQSAVEALRKAAQAVGDFADEQELVPFRGPISEALDDAQDLLDELRGALGEEID